MTMIYEPRGLTRREFIQGTAAIAASLGLSLTEAAEAQEKRAEAARETRPVRCAFVGVGAQGFGVDFKAAMSVPGVEMVAICDIYPPNLNRALKAVPTAKGYNDYRAVMDRSDIEAVLIATPLSMHAPIAIAALQSGKHVFSEKMMAYTIEEAKAMASAARAAKKVLQIGHQRRSDIMYNHAWELVSAKKVCGPVTHVRAQWNRNGSWRRPVPKDTTERHWNWRLYKEYSRGLMAELGTHQIQAVNWFLGAMPVAAVGMGGIDFWKDGRTVFDNVEVVFEYPGGVKLNYTSLTTNQFDGYYEQFMGREGTLVISEERATPTAYYREPGTAPEEWMKSAANPAEKGKHNELALKLDPQATKKLSQSGVKVGEKTLTTDVTGKNSYLLEMEDFFASVRTGAPISCDWRQGLGACVAAIRANEAMEKKTRVEISSTDYEL
jgi:predicted dehydrogenase